MAADKKTAANTAATEPKKAAAPNPKKPADKGIPARPAAKAAALAAAAKKVEGKAAAPRAAAVKVAPKAPAPKPVAVKAAARAAAVKAAPKPEAKKPEAKPPAPKPVAVKLEAKKLEAKKPEAKPPAPKPAVKPEAKQPAPKPPAPKPPAAKKPAPKPEAKKPAPKPEAKKPEAKPAAKAAALKAAPKAEAKKPEPAPPSPFAIGDKVVYPHHGAAVITRKERVQFQGQRTDYFVLEVATDQLILKVPVHTALERGVRPVISRVVARKVLATFKEPPEEAGANWSRWYKLLTEKINSGDIFQVAEVVRDLTFAQQTKGISPALKRMLSKARLILASELRFALDVTEEEAMRRLDKALPRAEAAEEL